MIDTICLLSEDSVGSNMMSPGVQAGAHAAPRQENRQPTVPLVDFVQQLEDYMPTVSFHYHGKITYIRS